MHCTNISAEFEFGGHSPSWVRTPKNVAFGYDVGKISAGCLVYIFCFYVKTCGGMEKILNLLGYSINPSDTFRKKTLQNEFTIW